MWKYWKHVVIGHSDFDYRLINEDDNRGGPTHSDDEVWDIPFLCEHSQATDRLLIADQFPELCWPILLNPVQ